MQTLKDKKTTWWPVLAAWLQKPAVCAGIKYGFSVLLTLAGTAVAKEPRYLFVGLAELLVIAAASEMLLCKNQWFGRIFNGVLMLLYNIQMGVLFFGGSYVVLVMLTNVESVESLSGKAVQYLLGVALVLLGSLLPLCPLDGQHGRGDRFLSAGLAAELLCTLLWGSGFSPLYGAGELAAQAVAAQKLRQSLSSEENLTGEFYNAGIGNYRSKDAALPETPNVILIFVEGLSQSIVEDARGVMPNVAKLESESLFFTGYYNHTFATYRGLSGQLYSGYQLDNLDENTLVSLQSVFGELGYQTAFVNTEPKNVQFTEYLAAMGFDELVGSVDDAVNGMANSISDKDAYELLFDTCQQKAAGDEPFFVAMYSYGTHASLDSPDETYGDGGNRVLNKFYNLDVQLGAFLEKFNASDLAEDTVLVFTTDHATYVESDFIATFPEVEYQHNSLAEIPLCIYYKGMTPQTVDVEGRNSLDMAPTVLDYLDISVPNYFLGVSLFAPTQNNNAYDTTYMSDGSLVQTDGKTVSELSEEKRTILEELMRRYYIAKTQEPQGGDA